MFYDAKSDYLGKLPERLREVVEFSALADAVNPEMDRLKSAIASMAANKAILTANSDGLLRWERMLGVSTPMNSTLQARREALVARLMTKPPINLKVLRGIIEAYMGLEVDIFADGHFVRVRYRGESRIKDLIPLYSTAYEIIPACMLLDISYRYLIWEEMDSLMKSFDALDAIAVNWEEFEKGEWI